MPLSLDSLLLSSAAVDKSVDSDLTRDVFPVVKGVSYLCASLILLHGAFIFLTAVNMT